MKIEDKDKPNLDDMNTTNRTQSKQKNSFKVEKVASTKDNSTKESLTDALNSDVKDESVEKQQRNQKEFGGPKGLEPTRYGDWESKGRCYDF